MKEISLCHWRLKLHGPVGNKLLLFRLMRASRKADAEYSNDHYNWLQWKRLLFKYISECTVNWAKVQLCLCSETASGFILSGRLCSLNLGFISVAECSRYLWLLFVREDAKPGRSGCFNTGSSWTAQALGRWGEGKAREWRVQPPFSIILSPLPKTPTCTLPQTWSLRGQCFWLNLWEESLRPNDNTSRAITLPRTTMIIAYMTVWTRQPRLSSPLCITKVCLTDVYSYPTL